MTDDPLLAKREEIRAIDRAILDLIAQRNRLASDIGALKRERGLPIRNYAVEADVIELARDVARDLGLRAEVAEEMMHLVIRESLRVQEAERARTARREASGRRALVIGGRGAMGAWFAEFLDGKGFSVAVADVRGPLEGYAFVGADWPERLENFDLVCVAVPPSRVADVLARLAGRTGALVFDIASLKSPFSKDLEGLAAQGMAVTSLHPMWGPRTDLLASKNLLVCDAGVPEANRAARALFADTAAHVVDLPIGAHDAHMAFTLGLPHALNLAFSRALAHSPFPLADLEGLGGPTFTKQVRVASEVASENKDLYFEIQRLNAHTPAVYAAMREAIDALERAVGSRDAFVTFMQACQDYYGER